MHELRIDAVDVMRRVIVNEMIGNSITAEAVGVGDGEMFSHVDQRRIAVGCTRTFGLRGDRNRWLLLRWLVFLLSLGRGKRAH